MAVRMQARQMRALIWVATIALVAVAGWNLWNIYQRLRAKKYEPRSATEFERLIGGATGSIPADEVRLPDWQKDYRPLLVETPINGYVKEAPKIVDTPKVEDIP